MRYLILALVGVPFTVIVGVAMEVLTRPNRQLRVQTPEAAPVTTQSAANE
jgi:hypothetical protein